MGVGDAMNYQIGQILDPSRGLGMTGGQGVDWRERDRKGMGEGRGMAFTDATDWRCASSPRSTLRGPQDERPIHPWLPWHYV